MGAAYSITVDTQTSVAIAVVTLAAAAGVHTYLHHDSNNIPIVGLENEWFAVQKASRKSIRALGGWITEGYRKYYGGVFKVRSLQRWHYVVSSPSMVEELRQLPDDVMSITEANAEIMQGDYTFGPHFRHTGRLLRSIIKSRLTRKLPELFPEVIDEVKCAFRDEIGSKLLSQSNEWTPMTVVPELMRVACRTSNRLFVGLPLCHNPAYIGLNVVYTIDVANSANIIKKYPWFLKPIVGRYMTPLPATLRNARKIMTPVFAHRIQSTEEHVVRGEKEWDGKPNDFLQWVLESGEPHELEIESLIQSFLRLNFAAIHTTAMSFTFALYQVAAKPDTVQESIRQEVHDLLSRYGWTKEAMEHMHKSDSLFRETQRFHGLGSLSVNRVALKKHMFSNGYTIPKGGFVAVAARPIHWDDTVYPNADTFDAFRFATDDTSESLENKFVNVSDTYLPFGVGRHAWFWAVNEMKAMMAYMVTHYEFKMENEGVVPAEIWYGALTIPDGRARVMFRRREAPVY